MTEGTARRALRMTIGNSCGGDSTKIHAAVEAYGYSAYLMISEGQRNDINYAIPVLEQINIEETQVMADCGYDSNKLLDCIYENKGEPTIPPKKGAKFTYYDYDKLIQLRDALSLANGYCFAEKKMVNSVLKFGFKDTTIRKWRAILELKEYFDGKMNGDVYLLF